MPDLVLPLRDPLQDLVLSAPQRYKALRWGRRVGKTRAKFLAGVAGHGSPERELAPKWPGILQGVDIVWLAIDYPQALAIWEEEIKPRFRGIAALNETEMSCAIPGGGTLWLKSSENVDTIRGLGKRLGGALFDECAHYDLDYAWRKVVRPALADNNGWAIFGSTTNAGWDGNALRETPSYFNRRCDDIAAGRLGADWGHWHATTRQSAHLDMGEIEALYEDLAERAPEELDAALILGGAGVWATEWRADLHVVAELPAIPGWWRWYAGYDWGYYDGWFGVAAVGDGMMIMVDELHHQRKDAEHAGFLCGQLCARYPVDSVGADGAMWAQTQAKKGVGPTIAEEWVRGFTAGFRQEMQKREERARAPMPLIVPAAHGAHARNTRSELLHRWLRWESVQGVPTIPSLRFLQGGCPYAIATISTVPKDPLRPNQPDTHAADHAWDGVGYLLQVRPEGNDQPPVGERQDVHPGLKSRYEQRMEALEREQNEDAAEKPRFNRYRPKSWRRLS